MHTFYGVFMFLICVIGVVVAQINFNAIDHVCDKIANFNYGGRATGTLGYSKHCQCTILDNFSNRTSLDIHRLMSNVCPFKLSALEYTQLNV